MCRVVPRVPPQVRSLAMDVLGSLLAISGDAKCVTLWELGRSSPMEERSEVSEDGNEVGSEASGIGSEVGNSQSRQTDSSDFAFGRSRSATRASGAGSLAADALVANMRWRKVAWMLCNLCARGAELSDC